MTSVRVTAFPRIHIGLIDLGHATTRKYGGIGIMLDWPAVDVIAERATHGQGVYFSDNFEDRDRASIENVVQDLKTRHGIHDFRVTIRLHPPPHVGLGSKTSVSLAVIRAIAALCNLDIDVETAQRLSRRGGVSGVGIHGFFLGGLIVDAGQPQDHLRHGPSSAAIEPAIPPLMIRHDVASNWTFSLILGAGSRYFGPTEDLLFARQTPIPRDDVLRSLAIVYHGIVPSIVTGDLEGFRTSLRAFHEVGFKMRELQEQSAETQRLFNSFSDLANCAVGMSSVGPLLYVVTSSPHENVMQEIARLSKDQKAHIVHVCPARNLGYVLQRI
jgi:beta-ribofuranosylaminobenzene 5'-phosphate synthase